MYPPLSVLAISLENRVMVGAYHIGSRGENLEVNVENIGQLSGVWTALHEH